MHDIRRYHMYTNEHLHTYIYTNILQTWSIHSLYNAYINYPHLIQYPIPNNGLVSSNHEIDPLYYPGLWINLKN